MDPGSRGLGGGGGSSPSSSVKLDAIKVGCGHHPFAQILDPTHFCRSIFIWGRFEMYAAIQHSCIQCLLEPTSLVLPTLFKHKTRAFQNVLFN